MGFNKEKAKSFSFCYSFPFGQAQKSDKTRPVRAGGVAAINLNGRSLKSDHEPGQVLIVFFAGT
jgi:hypothetical protein